MKLTAKIKLQPTEKQFNFLVHTIAIANATCNHISQRAWDTQTFKQFDIHHLVYKDIRSEEYPLSAQMVVRAIAKVADAYKLDKKVKRSFNPTGAIAYDARILSWKMEDQTISIWTIKGRQRMPFVCGKRQKELLKSQRGESDLVLIDGTFYLFATCDIDEPTPDDVEDCLGIDLGIVNIATTSDGEQFAGNQVNSVRQRRRRQRKRLQKKGTKSAKRVAKRLSGKERRFAAQENHRISKQIVKKAKDTNRAIALENLKGIRQRVRLRKPQRVNLHSWSFHQLGQFILYKAILAGVPVVFVDPRNTSRKCSKCGCVDKRSRKSQSNFSCTSCGYTLNADYNAAKNISVLGWGGLSSVRTAQVSTS